MSESMSPFGGNEILVEELPVGWLVHEYYKKSGIDVSECFSQVDHITLYECSNTGFRYWKPFSIAGSENFYRVMASSTSTYYPKDRWENSIVRKILRKEDDVLDIGCGRGFFLKSIQCQVKNGLGLEFSQYAIDNKVTTFPIRIAMIQDMAKEKARFDVVCSFQVLEHVVNPKEFIQGCLEVLKPGGKLVLSTPNYASTTFQNKSDCWDLPPHHVGHYTEDVYKRIGELFGLKLVSIHQQIRGPEVIPVTQATQSKLIHKVFRKLAIVTSMLLFRFTREPGHTIVAVFEKHA